MWLASCAPMTSTIRVAALEELPPGKGRVVDVAGRHIAVFNRDGRFYARAAPKPRRTPVPLDTSTCAPWQGEFDVWMEDSPARLEDEPACAVKVDGDAVYLVVD
jgi:hypothetical protein